MTKSACIIYKGHELRCWREQSLGCGEHLYYSIFRESDGLECASGFTTDTTPPAEYIDHMKARVDAEMACDDPWGEHTQALQ